MTTLDRYAVMGNPIAHSKSPRIHTLFAQQTGQALSYDAILVEAGAFASAVQTFVAQGGKGLNVTVPFKQEAWQLCSRRSARAQRAEAVNTLRIEADGGLYGDNTDGVGLVRDLTVNHGCRIEAARVLVLGAGGAVRGVLEPLLEQRPGQLTIANRTAAKAADLAAAFDASEVVRGGGFEGLSGQAFDLIINGTAASLQGEVPPLPGGVLAPGAACYDMMYGAEPTAFVHWAQTHGAQHAWDGLGMLVEQAAESFLLWRGVRPQTAEVIERLRAELGGA